MNIVTIAPRRAVSLVLSAIAACAFVGLAAAPSLAAPAPASSIVNCGPYGCDSIPQTDAIDDCGTYPCRPSRPGCGGVLPCPGTQVGTRPGCGNTPRPGCGNTLPCPGLPERPCPGSWPCPGKPTRPIERPCPGNTTWPCPGLPDRPCPGSDRPCPGQPDRPCPGNDRPCPTGTAPGQRPAPSHTCPTAGATPTRTTSPARPTTRPVASGSVKPTVSIPAPSRTTTSPAAPATQPGGNSSALPNTGANALTGLLIGAALMALGGAFVVFTRKRRTHRSLL